MIISRLHRPCIGLNTLIQQKPIWRLCFNWLRNMPKDQSFGHYNLDHQIVTALYFQLANDGSQTESITALDSFVQIHYIVEGVEKIKFLCMDENLMSENQGVQKSCLPKMELTQNPGDIIILFPTESCFGRSSVFGKKAVKKVVITIPIQRFN